MLEYKCDELSVSITSIMIIYSEVDFYPNWTHFWWPFVTSRTYISKSWTIWMRTRFGLREAVSSDKVPIHDQVSLIIPLNFDTQIIQFRLLDCRRFTETPKLFDLKLQIDYVNGGMCSHKTVDGHFNSMYSIDRTRCQWTLRIECCALHNLQPIELPSFKFLHTVICMSNFHSAPFVA